MWASVGRRRPGIGRMPARRTAAPRRVRSALTHTTWNAAASATPPAPRSRSATAVGIDVMPVPSGDTITSALPTMASAICA